MGMKDKWRRVVQRKDKPGKSSNLGAQTPAQSHGQIEGQAVPFIPPTTPPSSSIQGLENSKPADNHDGRLRHRGYMNAETAQASQGDHAIGTNNSEQNGSTAEWGDLWRRAFDTLLSDQPRLAEIYAEIMACERASPQEMVLDSTQSPALQLPSNKDLTLIVSKNLESIITAQGKPTANFDRAVKVILSVKGFISEAVSAEPHAALAWAGVCIFLPLLINPLAQLDACVVGLEELPFIIQRYAVLEPLLSSRRNEDNKDIFVVRGQFVVELVKLYSKILQYQAQVICQLKRPNFAQYIRDTFKVDEWQQLLSSIQTLDQRCQSLAETIDKDACLRGLEKQNALLSELKETWQLEQEAIRQQQEAIHQLQQEQIKVVKETNLEVMEIVAEQQRNKQNNCIRIFRSGNLYEEHKDRNPRRVPGTCQWFLQHSKFRSWRDSEHSALLWVSADPGCGKSVLSKALVDENLLYATGSDVTVCYFFFKDVSPEQRSGGKAMSALLHQIFVAKRDLVRYAMPSYDRNREELVNLINDMWDILEQIVMDPLSGSIICVLDALDECEGTSRACLCQRLEKFFSSESETKLKAKLKFIVTSRPYYDIEQLFSGLENTFPAIHLVGEDESEDISNEINLVIAAKVAELDLGEKVGKHLQERLESIPHRTYLWLHLIMDILHKRAKASKRAKKFDEILDAPLPGHVGDAYKAILDKSIDRKEALKLLHIIVAAVRPMTLQEVNVAMYIDYVVDGTQTFEDIELEDERTFLKRVRNLCGLFVTVVDSKLYLIHQTAKEYLVCPPKAQPSMEDWGYSLEPGTSHTILAKSCLAHLFLEPFGDPAFFAPWQHRPDSSDCELLTVPNNMTGFLAYASAYWATHFRKALTDEISIDTVADLVQPSSKRRSMYLERDEWKAEGCSYLLSHGSALTLASYAGLHPLVSHLLDDLSISLSSTQFAEALGPALCIAAEKGFLSVVEVLIKWRPDLCFHDFGRRHPLLIAAESGHLGIIQSLLEYDTNRDTQDDRDSAVKGLALLIAAKRGQVDAIRLLLEHIAEDSQRLLYCSTALLEAAEYGREDIVRLLTGKGAKVDERGLAMVALAGREECLRILLDRNAYVPTTSFTLNSALEAAIWINRPEIIRLIQKHQIDKGNGRRPGILITDSPAVVLREDIHADKDPYDSPNADCEIYRVLTSTEFKASSEAFRVKDPKETIISLIYPTPLSTPSSIYLSRPSSPRISSIE